jgi:hypothetical protein
VTATTTVSEVTDDYAEADRAHILQDKDIPDYVTVFGMHGRSCSRRPTNWTW